MEPSSFSFLSYKELRNLSKSDSSFLLKAEIAYKQDKYPRAKKALNKLRKINPTLIDQYLFFLSLGHEDVDYIVNNVSDDPLVVTCIDYLKFYLREPSKEEIINRNFYLYLLLFYFPDVEVDDLAYGYPNDMYGEALYVFSLYKKVFLIKDLRKYAKQLKKNDKGIRSFLNLYERETLDFLSRNSYMAKNDFLVFDINERRYQDLRNITKEKREETLNSLEEKDCIKNNEDHIELMPGGFFLLSCY